MSCFRFLGFHFLAYPKSSAKSEDTGGHCILHVKQLPEIKVTASDTPPGVSAAENPSRRGSPAATPTSAAPDVHSLLGLSPLAVLTDVSPFPTNGVTVETASEREKGEQAADFKGDESSEAIDRSIELIETSQQSSPTPVFGAGVFVDLSLEDYAEVLSTSALTRALRESDGPGANSAGDDVQDSARGWHQQDAASMFWA